MPRLGAAAWLVLLHAVPLCLAALPWLTVRPVDLEANPASLRRHVLADEFGRELTLRGACFESEERNLPGAQRPVDPAGDDALNKN